MFEQDLTRNARRRPSVIASGSPQLELDLGRPMTASVARLDEDITRGQNVARYTLYGAASSGEWRVVCHGSTIGYAKLEIFEPVTVRRVRLTVEDAAGIPQGIGIRLYNPSAGYSQ